MNRDRNTHLHENSLYSIIANFSKIKILINNNYQMIFNPTKQEMSFAFDFRNKYALDSCTIIFQQLNGQPDLISSNELVNDLKFDMIGCEFGIADLITECRTIKSIQEEFPNQQFKGADHFFIIYYGKQRYIFPLSKNQVQHLKIILIIHQNQQVEHTILDSILYH